MGYQQQQGGNGMAVAGFVLGLLSIVPFFLVPYVAIILGILGFIFGMVGMGKAKRVGKGRGMAIAGTVLGAIGTLIAIAIFVAAVMFVRSHKNDFDKALQESIDKNNTK